MDVLAYLAPIHDAAGVAIGSPSGYVVMCFFWALVWGVVSFLSLQFLTPRDLSNVPDAKRWHVRLSLRPFAHRRERAAVLTRRLTLVCVRCCCRQWARTVSSCFHAALTALLACYYLMSGSIDLWDHFEAPHPVWEQVVCISLGYFLHDLIQIFTFKPTPSDFYVSTHTSNPSAREMSRSSLTDCLWCSRSRSSTTC